MCRKLIYLIGLVLVPGLFGNASADLIAYWPLDTEVIDLVGGHDGTLVRGAQFTDDPEKARVLSVDGVDDRVEIPHSDKLVFGPSDSFSVAVWLNIRSLPGNWAGIVNKSRDISPWYGLWVTPGNQWHFVGGEGGANVRMDVGAAATGWLHLTGVYDAETHTQTVYVDGAVIDENTDVTITATGAGDVWFGGAKSVTEFLDALIDDVRIYDHALTEEEILSIMLSGGEGYPLASRPNPEDGTYYADTWVTLSWRPGDFAVSHDVYLGDIFDDVENATRDSDVFRGNQNTEFYIAGFPGFAYPEGLVPGTTYYWRIDEVNDADPNSPWKGDVWSFSIPPKTAYNPDPSDGAGIAETTVTLTWTAGFGAKLHTIYFGDDFDIVANATVGTPAGTTTYNPGPLEAEKVYYWRVDEFDGLGTYKGGIWAFTTPGAVGNPQPAHNAVDAGMNATMSWTPADSAASHQLYLGTDKAAVRNADTDAPEYKGSIALGAESHDPGLLEADTTYYWRVDEVDAQGNTVKGPIWIFMTGDFLLVDDFESYTDDDTAGEAIWQTWVDGFGDANNGAQVGYLLPPYTEQTIVHGGAQSMPLSYVNEAGVTNSEGAMTLTTPRDWTVAGVVELSLWFRGDSANAVEPLYVAISNTSGLPVVAAHDDPRAATAATWTEWRIALQTFADQGISLSNVDKIGIGLGSTGGAAAGGSGTMYIDDIRLNRP